MCGFWERGSTIPQVASYPVKTTEVREELCYRFLLFTRDNRSIMIWVFRICSSMICQRENQSYQPLMNASFRSRHRSSEDQVAEGVPFIFGRLRGCDYLMGDSFSHVLWKRALRDLGQQRDAVFLKWGGGAWLAGVV